MKTREELIKMLGTEIQVGLSSQYTVAFDKDYSNKELNEILNAPTQEQMECKYCHGGRKAKPIVADSSDFLAFDKSGIVAFGNDGSVTTGENYTKIKYCPMCARKLGDY